VLGLGRSGLSAARFLAERGAKVVAADERPGEALGDLASLPSSVELHVGRPLPSTDDYDLVVPSPGIPVHRWHEARDRVVGDIELSGRHLQVPIAAVTGTNGKSTTVALLEAMLRAAGLRATAAGNLGLPALELVGRPLDVAVLEVSSFQLESTSTFRPHVAAVLNVTPDHLDRHGDLETYAAMKARLLAHQTPEDFAVLNFEDPIVRDMASHTAAQIVRVSARGTPSGDGERSAWVDAGVVVLADSTGLRRISLEGIRLAGRHNLENVVTALAMAWCLGADVERAASALSTFEALPHRCEVVARHQGVTFVDDSKATNVGAAVKSLAAFSEPVVWIAGGRGKGADFAELTSVAASHARIALLIGEAAAEIEAALDAAVPHERVGTLEGAVERAVALAKPGDVVLLAPACASFDQFTSFEARGDAFELAVRAITEGAPDA
jgi:UDP-N-acetylmuramoylalanine--D-glutamate ligase